MFEPLIATLNCVQDYVLDVRYETASVRLLITDYIQGTAIIRFGSFIYDEYHFFDARDMMSLLSEYCNYHEVTLIVTEVTEEFLSFFKSYYFEEIDNPLPNVYTLIRRPVAQNGQNPGRSYSTRDDCRRCFDL